jgi:colanic acid/amylovoran biosynthesis glycosyltransferase
LVQDEIASEQRPLRIAYLVWRFPVLSETFISNEIGGALARGHDVTVLPFAKPAAVPADRPDPEQLEIARRVVPLTLPRRLYEVPAFAALAWRRRRAIPRVAAALDPRRFGRAQLKIRLIHQALRLAELAPFDLLHCQFGTLGLIGHRLRACGLLHGRLITTFRGHDISQYLREQGAGVYRGLFEHGDHFLTNCDFFRRRLVELGCDPARLSVQRSGVAIDRFPFRARSAPADGRVVLATVGRLVEKKGIADCLQALASVVGDHPRLSYRVLGDGPLRAELEALTDRLGLRPRVTFLGAGDQGAVRRLLEDAHLFLGPSVTAADGDQDAPINTLKEAMAMGVPVISTWHGGIPELVEDGVSGRLVPERDPAALANALRELLMAPDCWPMLARAARAEIEANWDRERLNDQLDALYRSVAQAGARYLQ